eukprot:4408580-Prymnesium_polylepis.1
MCSFPRLGQQRRSSLACESGVYTSLVISIIIIFGHVLFGYAQASGLNTECNSPAGDACEQGGQMSISGGGLFRGEIKGRVAFEAERALAIAVAAVEGASCQALIDCPNGAQSPVHLPASKVDLCTVLECGGASLDQTVFHHSYWFSIEQMWEQDASANHTGYYPARPAAATLFAFSFVWPHLKLLLMHLFFYLPVRSRLRRNVNYWLSFWGKWSLADAIVMCCLIGLFNLTIDMDFVEAWGYFKNDAISFCHSECLKLQNTSAVAALLSCNSTCAMVESALAAAALNYESLPSSEVYVNLRVSGLMSMYSFCLAVLVSLCTGVTIENLDEFLRERQDGADSQQNLKPFVFDQEFHPFRVDNVPTAPES